MATFRVGQRVRLIARSGLPLLWLPTDQPEIGDEGTVEDGLSLSRAANSAAPGWFYQVRFDEHHSGSLSGFYSVAPHQLAPLVDPAADAFLARIKRLAHEPKPLNADELHTVRGGVA